MKNRKITTWTALFLAAVLSVTAYANYDGKPLSNPKGGTGSSSQTPHRAATTDANGNLVSVSATTDTEIGYVSGLTSSVQSQLGGKLNQAMSNILSSALNASLLPASSGSANLGSASFPFGIDFTNGLELMGSSSANHVVIQAAASTTPYTNTWPAAVASVAGQMLSSDTAGVLSWVTGGSSGANTALSNLISTSINQHLLPNASNTFDLGAGGFTWRDSYFSGIIHGNSWANSTGARELDWISGNIVPNVVNSIDFGLLSSRFHNIFSGLFSMVGATSGSIQHQAAAVTTPYTVTWPGAVASVAGQVLASTTGGVLSWVTPATGTVTGTGTTNQMTKWSAVSGQIVDSSMSDDGTTVVFSINATPTTDQSINLGSASIRWNSLFVASMVFNGQSIDLANEVMKESSGTTVIDWENERLYDSGGTPSVRWGNRQLRDSGGSTTVSWDTSELISSGNTSINWQNRILFASDGTTPMVDFSTAGTISASSNLVSNVLDPVSAQDAATKNYVDNKILYSPVSDLGDADRPILSSESHVRTTTTLTAIRTYTLPACAANIGEKLEFKNTPAQTFNIIIAGAGGDLVDGSATATASPSDSIAIICAVAGTWDKQ